MFSDKPELLEILIEEKQGERKKGEGKGVKILTSPTSLSQWSQLVICLRLIREQKQQVSKVLLDGLYDPDCPLHLLLGAHHVFMKEVWLELGKEWQIFHDQ